MIANFLNLCLCFAMGYSAMCRLGAMTDRVTLRAAWLYVALFAASVLSGLQFFLVGTLANWADVAAAAFVCVLLAVSLPQWRSGPPRHCLRA
jgi:hypothetical protein